MSEENEALFRRFVDVPRATGKLTRDGARAFLTFILKLST
jgi:hypothetical protein